MYFHLWKMIGHHSIACGWANQFPPEQSIPWKWIMLNNKSESPSGTLPFLLFMVIIAKKTTFLISLHKQIFCLPKECTCKICENIFKGQFVQSSDKPVYFSLDLIKEWIIMSQELLYERTAVGGFELLASLCPRWSENWVSGCKSLGNRSSFRRDALQGTSLCGFPEWGLPLPSFQPALLLLAGYVGKTEIATMYYLL